MLDYARFGQAQTDQTRPAKLGKAGPGHTSALAPIPSPAPPSGSPAPNPGPRVVPNLQRRIALCETMNLNLVPGVTQICMMYPSSANV